ncbi:related to a-agglutinin core protein AGA1 [Rhynchosporium graminicola]|uniref:Related to a-agglutinin core protein AGA1 n=1 Tax=Rhynchosporium graminicola TaxID=2792576 RepID=A0A1E1L815_9HELO|nr:related to a-agglutinin core protein AGA1 [Rhynchosporium commune]
MSSSTCQSCRILLVPLRPQGLRSLRIRKYSSDIEQSDALAINSSPNNLPTSQRPREKLNIAALLSKPTWSVRSLLSPTSAPPSTEITPRKLHHLLRLSALPLPKTPEEEASMLTTLHSQLQFLKNIQDVNTDGVEPLQSLRDETEEGIKNITIGLETLKDALGEEDIKGRNKRPRRRRRESLPVIRGVEDWDALKTASEKVETPMGKYFIVRSGKGDTVHMTEEAKEASLNRPSFQSATASEVKGSQTNYEPVATQL